jgi:type VII secretion-associated serine protease mycosin
VQGSTRWRRVAGTTASALLLLTGIWGGQEASADQVRDGQWPLTAFKATTRVWPNSTGKGVVVAVIDSGVRATHQDLVGQILPGKDFNTGGNGWTDRDPTGHGTAMASLIAAHGHGPGGSEGVKGLAPDARILPLAVALDGTLQGEQHEIDAIHYAVDHGAGVINMSFAAPAESSRIAQAVGYAEAHNVVVVAGAGNSGGLTVQWPAAEKGVIAVGAVDKNGRIWSDSNRGPGLILAAPGVDIVAASSRSDTGYDLSDGTSDAAAYVSAEAALVRSKYPDLTAGQVVNRLIKSADNPDISHTPSSGYGYGIIRPDTALTSDIPAGPAIGPLPQTTVSAAPTAPVTAATPRQPTSSSLPVRALLGGLAAVVAFCVAVFVVVLRRRYDSHEPRS